MKFRGGDFSTGTTGNFQPELTPKVFRPNRCKFFRMAGTTRLELATSAVTAQRRTVSQQLTTARGLPNDAQDAQGYTNCGLDCGLENRVAALGRVAPEIYFTLL